MSSRISKKKERMWKILRTPLKKPLTLENEIIAIFIEELRKEIENEILNPMPVVDEN